VKAKLLVFSLLCCSASLLGQDPVHTSTLDVSAGGTTYAYNYFNQRGGPAFGGRYEYRLWKYVAIEAGVDALWPKSYSTLLVGSLAPGTNLITVSPGCTGCVYVPFSERNRVTLVPFGAKAILPLAHGRIELFLGAGGAYAWHSDYGSYRNGMFAQGSLGARVALDRNRHYWLGTSVRTYTKGNSETWISWTADFGFRFGH